LFGTAIFVMALARPKAPAAMTTGIQGRPSPARCGIFAGLCGGFYKNTIKRADNVLKYNATSHAIRRISPFK
jgi:hypothetical protein